MFKENTLEEQIAVLEQIVVEDKFSRHNIRETVRNDILKSLDSGLRGTFGSVCKAIDAYICKRYYKSKDERIQAIRHVPTIDIAIEMFIAVTPHDTFTAIQGVAAAIGNQLEYEDVFDGAKTGAELLGACVSTGLHDIQSTSVSETGSLELKSLVSLDPETIAFVNNTRYLPPSLAVKPWISNINGGHFTKNSSVILKSHNFHMKKQALDVLNQLQEIEWELDMQVLKEPEESKKPFETEKQEIAWTKMVQDSKRIYSGLLAHSNKFHFVNKYDFRGRIYTQGYHVNLQSTSYKKAMLNFKKREVVK